MSRPRGFIEWNPNPATRIVLTQVNAVLQEYRQYLPLTVRQIFYRLVGEYGYDKTELAYNRLAEYLVKARRARLVKFDSIRDDGTTELVRHSWESPEQFWDSVRVWADEYELDHQADQEIFIELWCEAAGMAPMLRDMVAEWSVPVYSTGGFASVTVTHEIAVRVAKRNVPTVFLHVGDFDPSGESIFDSMTRDVLAFLGGLRHRFSPIRTALTEDQVMEHDLPTAPPKRSDSRSVNWYGSTTQLEAMPPDLLERTVQDAVKAYIDEDALAETLMRETRERHRIARVLSHVDEDQDD